MTTRNFCPHCGSQLRRPGAAFCPTCGRSLTAAGSTGARVVSTAGTGPTTAPGPRPALDAPASAPTGRVAPARLVVQEPGRPAVTIPLRGDATIGRERDNDIVISHPAVSRHHARLEERTGGHWLADLGSTNGTYLNGQLLDDARCLQPSDIIRIGDRAGNSVSLVYHEANGASRPHAQTIRLEGLDLQQTTAYTIGRDPGNRLHLDHPAVSRRHAEVRQTEQGAVIRDLGSQNGTFVNGQRVRGNYPLQQGDVIHIGPYKLVHGVTGATLLNPAGNYRLDAFSLRRVVTLGSALSPARFLRRHRQGTTRVILDDISISVYPREFIALVGGSGAGKSTLLKALSGVTPAEGRVYVNGDDLYTNFAAYRSILGYVPQDDIIHGGLTVDAALHYAARLRLPDASLDEIERRIARVLDQVEMAEHSQKQIDRLSGGQRKRVSIAVELLAEPGLFFLDEPTSGLDPGLEKKMMYTLRRLADDGRTILLVTHATANIEQCTHVAFLAGGRLAYYGPPNEALVFFGASDFSDIYTRLSQPVEPAQLPAPCQQHYLEQRRSHPAQAAPSPAALWADCYRASPDYERYINRRIQQREATGQHGALQRKGQRVSRLQQLAVLTRRYFNLIRRDATSLFILLAVMPILGLLLLAMTGEKDLVGAELPEVRSQIQTEIAEARDAQDPAIPDEEFRGTYSVGQESQRLVFMLGLAVNLLGIFAASYEIVKERPIYQRERMVNLKIMPYLSSKLLVLSLFAALQTALLLLVVSLKVDFPANGILMPAPLEMYLTLLLSALAAIGLGLFISAATPGRDAVIYIIFLILFVQIMFSGSLFDPPPISYLTTTRWTMEALGATVDLQAVNEKGVTCIEFEDPQTAALLGEPEPPCVEGQMKQPFRYPFYVDFDHTASHLLTHWLALLGFTVFFTTGAYILQKRKDVV